MDSTSPMVQQIDFIMEQIEMATEKGWLKP